MAVSPPPSPSLVRSAHIGALLPIRPPAGGSLHTALGLRSPAAWLVLARRALRSRREPKLLVFKALRSGLGCIYLAKVVRQDIHKVSHRKTGQPFWQLRLGFATWPRWSASIRADKAGHGHCWPRVKVSELHRYRNLLKFLYLQSISY